MSTHGGTRSGAGRKPKPLAQKQLEGNPGKRALEALDFATGTEIPVEPADWLNARAKTIYKSVYEWLEKIGCLKGILPAHLEEYAHLKARWHLCEEQNENTGLLYKDDNGKPKENPLLKVSEKTLRQVNSVWAKIYQVVRETQLREFDPSIDPNNDVMLGLLSTRPKK